MAGGVSRIAAPLALAVALTTTGAVRAQAAPAAKPPIVARAEQCLRQKVDRVAADEPDIAAAANFLVGYACAEEVAGATRYLRSETYVQLFSTIFKAMATSGPPKPQGQDKGSTPPATSPSGAAGAAKAASAMLSQLKVDPETGEIRIAGDSDQAKQANEVIRQSSSIVGQFMPDNIPVPIRKLAGDLVLEAHERNRLK